MPSACAALTKSVPTTSPVALWQSSGRRSSRTDFNGKEKWQMLKLLPLLLAASLLSDCAARQPKVKIDPIPALACPSWKDVTPSRKAKLADELLAAAPEAVWPEVLIADQSLKDQLVAGGCPPVK
jgi:hypothetical protein